MEPKNLSPIPQMPQQEMASPEQKQELQDMIGAVRGNLANMNTAMFQGKNKNEATRIDSLRQVFAALRKAGVDLEDPDSVNQFIEALRQKNPEMADLLEQALTTLIGKEVETSPNDTEPLPPPQEQLMG